MAITALKDELERVFKRDISDLAVNELHRHKTEALVFNYAKIEEYYEWVKKTMMDDYGLTVTGSASAAASAMLVELERKANTSPEPLVCYHRPGQYLKIIYLVKDTMRSYFHTVTDKNGRQKPQGAMRRKVQLAKVEGRKVFGVENSLSKAQKGQLGAGMHGHHGGTTTPSQSVSRRIILPEEYTGTIGGSTAVETDFHSSRANRTTKGMLKGSDVVAAKLGGKSATVDDLFAETDGKTADGMLVTVFLTSLADWFDVNMGWNRTPSGAAKSTSRTEGDIVLNNTVFVEFALGRGTNALGNGYTDAMKDWDAGGSNRLFATINKLLDNIEIKIVERVMKGTEKNAFRLVEMKGSPSFADKIDVETKRTIVANLFKHKSTPNMRYKVNKRIYAEAKKTRLRKGQAKTNKAIKGMGVRMAGGAALPRTKGKRATSKVQAKAGQNPLALRNMLNEILPVAIAGNMTAPALQYRTGRFANSVRVDNVTQGPRGGNTMIEASYMNDPYETFAPGGKKHTPQRDPEKLIRRTLREVATGIIGKRFGVKVR